MHTFDLATVISLLVGTVLPVVVGRVTTVHTHPALKGATLLALSTITSVLTQWLDALNSGTPFLWQTVVVSSVLTFSTGVATHAGLWKHTPLSNTDTTVGKHEAGVN